MNLRPQPTSGTCILAEVGTKTGFPFPGRWPAREPADVHARKFLTWDELEEVVWSHTTASGLIVEARAAGLLVADFRAVPAALPPATGPDGIVPFEESIAAMRVRVQVCNALALGIHSATVRLQDVAIPAFRITHEGLVHFFSSGRGQAGQLNAVPDAGFLMPQDRFGVCPPEVLEEASDAVGSLIVSSQPRALDLVELVNNSLVACQDHDFGLALVSAWTVCEVALDMALVEYAEHQARLHGLSVNRERRRVWSGLNAATTAETLALAGIIPQELGERIDQARRARNRWVHGVKRHSWEVAREGVELAADLMGRYAGHSFSVAPVIGIQGFDT